MTTFSYTTGNPSNLTAAATASMNDIQGPLTDLRTFLNGANIDSTNIAASGVTTSTIASSAVTFAKLTPLFLYGSVNGGTGAISFAGSGGWSSSRSSLGVYILTFSPVFSSGPALLITAVGNGSYLGMAQSNTTSAATVTTYLSTNGGNVDANFSFAAIGVR